MDYKNLDYSPITSASTYEHDTQKLQISGRKRARLIRLIIILVVIPPLWPIGIIWYIVHLIKEKNVSKERIKSIRAFAEKHGFSFTDLSGKIVLNDGTVKDFNAEEVFKAMGSSLQEMTLDNLKKPLPLGEQYNLPFEVDDIFKIHKLEGVINGYSFSYEMSSLYVGKPQQSSQFPYILFVVQLPVQLPKVFLDAKSNDLKGLDPKAMNFNIYEDHELEGDFHKYYSVRIERDEHINMYSILTPEVMQILKENHLYDVWLSGDQLILLTFADQARYFAGIPIAFKTAELLINSIDVIAREVRRESRQNT